MPLSNPSRTVLLAQIGGTQLGIPADAVREIIRAVAIAPLSGAPAIIEGAINLHGRIVPVVDLRRRFGMPAAPTEPDQFMIVIESGDRLIAVRVDDVDDVTDVAGELTAPGTLSPVIQNLAGVAAAEGGTIVIHDVNAFLTQAEAEALDLLTPQSP